MTKETEQKPGHRPISKEGDDFTIEMEVGSDYPDDFLPKEIDLGEDKDNASEKSDVALSRTDRDLRFSKEQKTETLDFIRARFKKRQEFVDKMKKKLIDELEKKRYESVLFIYRNRKNELTEKQIKDIEFIQVEGAAIVVERKERLEELKLKSNPKQKAA